MRAVLDPNVTISALLWRDGTPARVLRLWVEGTYELVCSPKLLDELRRALTYPKLTTRIHPGEADALLTLLGDEALVQDDPRTPPSVTSADPDDDYLIALAEQSRSLLVSGDSDLLDLADQAPIYSPREFLEYLTPEV
ncbi:MAG: putative toxin-antitoxin system toxin component, PIN family [Acidimicrobiia bacterium]